MTITEKRRSLNMSLGECARKVGIATVEMSRIEMARRVPDDEIVGRIGAVLNLSFDEVKSMLPSKEQADADYCKLSDSLAAMGAAMAHSKAAGLGRGKGGSGQMECPICKGTLKYSVAGVNGHVWGACTTEGCVRWMQ